MSQNEYKRHLERALMQAHELAHDEEALAAYIALPPLARPLKTMRSGEVVDLGKSVSDGIATIVSNLRQTKSLFSILITCLAKKLVNPEQDIRIAQAGLSGGYSNRSTDQTYVTPFLKEYGLTHSAASGMESGRNFERPLPLGLDFPTNPRGEGNKEAFLGLLHAIEQGVDPMPCLVLLMVLDLRSKTNLDYEYPKLEGVTVEQALSVVRLHHELAEGVGRARLPVLAIQAVYQCLVPEVQRYRGIGAELLDLQRHTANDKLGWIGDIQVDRLEGVPFEGVEVKSGKKIDVSMVNVLPKKFQGQAVDRYYILSTEEQYIEEVQHGAVEDAVVQMRERTGCQVIVNGLYPTLRYYLRLISDTSEFLAYYTNLVETDEDVKVHHRALWSEVLTDLATPKSVSSND